MKISFVIPLLNRPNTVRQAIDSILNQTYPDIEVVVADGGSAEPTLAILRSYGDRSSERFDERVRWTSESDSGTSDAMNKGVRRATGEFVSFLCADDYLAANDVVARAVEELERAPDTDLLCADVQVIDEHDGHPVRVIKSDPDRLAYRMSIELPGAFVRRSMLEKKPFDPSFKITNDHECFCYLKEVLGARVRYVPRTHVVFRLGGMCNDVRNAVRTARERFRIRRTYYGLWWALPFYVTALATSYLRQSGFRPQTWLRRLRRRA